ncbi:MAG: FtsK/SpoIIIE domain-containing protein [Bacteroidaceae bacterium]|nr:FtsK/SpoIIIE domain-containing protein [Bacteroidaceae bacterium]
MEKKLLSITDEEAILITAEFLILGKKNKVGEKSVVSYAIDLVVNNSTTIDQLLVSIGVGLQNMLDENDCEINADDSSFWFYDDKAPIAKNKQTLIRETALAACNFPIDSDIKFLGKLELSAYKKARKKILAEDRKQGEIRSAEKAVLGSDLTEKIRKAANKSKTIGNDKIKVIDRATGQATDLTWGELRVEAENNRDKLILIENEDCFYEWFYKTDDNLSGPYSDEYASPSEAEKNNRKTLAALTSLFSLKYKVDFKCEEQEESGEGIPDFKKSLEKSWIVFLRCYKAYLNDGKDNPETEADLDEEQMDQPVIHVSSINIEKLGEGELLCNSSENRIELHRKNGGRSLKDSGFITTTRIVFDPCGWWYSAPLFDKGEIIAPFKEDAPKYNISERPLRTLDDEPVQIIPPTDIPQKNKQSIITSLLSPLLMTGMMVGIRLFSYSGSSSMSNLLMFGGMGLVSGLTAVVNLAVRNGEHKKSVAEWRTQYQEYIRNLLKKINEKQDQDKVLLQKMYPPVVSPNEQQTDDLIHKALSINGDIFSRGREHPDFLKIRIGVSGDESELVPSVFEIKGEKKEAVFASVKYKNILDYKDFPFTIILPKEQSNDETDHTLGFLIDLPSDIARKYKYLHEAPILLSLKKCRSLGIVFEDDFDFQPFLSNIIFDLCFYQSPDDLQIVMLCEETDNWSVKQNTINRYKHLPHFGELLGDMSPFAFEKNHANRIFNKLLEILSERKKNENDEKYCHIVVFVLDEHGLKSHLISEYLPEYSEDEEKNKEKDYGISFVFCKRFPELLPKYCEYTIHRLKQNSSDSWYLLPHSRIMSEDETNKDPSAVKYDPTYLFRSDQLAPDANAAPRTIVNNYNRAFKMLSALYYERIAQGAGVPSSLNLFDIIPRRTEEEKMDGQYEPDKIRDKITKEIFINWGITEQGKQDEITYNEKLKRTISSVSVPIGRSANGETELDLHEKADGPHMLVAGTTGSGKTETVLTYLISLCETYSPEQVNLLLVDMKGAGFVQRIGDAEKGSCLPHVVGTITDIAGDETGTGTAYMLKRFLQSMNAEVKRRKVYLNRMGVDSVDGYTKARTDLKKHIKAHPKLNIEELKKLPPLPHLFLIIDEFTELMRFTSENSDVDFKSSITSLARIGRSLGFHIILISQNIENAITPDIRVNSRARLCLKVATRDASKEMIGTDLAASPMMPGNGRAYLLIGTGSRFEYFQSGYSGADITGVVHAPITVTAAKAGDTYTSFADSGSKNYSERIDFLKSVCVDKGKTDSEKRNIETEVEGTYTDGEADSADSKGTANNTDTTQLKMVVDIINECFRTSGIQKPHRVFQQPLPKACYYSYDWKNGTGNVKEMKDRTNDSSGKTRETKSEDVE